MGCSSERDAGFHARAPQLLVLDPHILFGQVDGRRAIPGGDAALLRPHRVLPLWVRVARASFAPGATVTTVAPYSVVSLALGLAL